MEYSIDVKRNALNSNSQIPYDDEPMDYRSTGLYFEHLRKFINNENLRNGCMKTTMLWIICQFSGTKMLAFVETSNGCAPKCQIGCGNYCKSAVEVERGGFFTSKAVRIFGQRLVEHSGGGPEFGTQKWRGELGGYTGGYKSHSYIGKKKNIKKLSHW